MGERAREGGLCQNVVTDKHINVEERLVIGASGHFTDQTGALGSAEVSGRRHACLPLQYMRQGVGAYALDHQPQMLSWERCARVRSLA